jgi:hypothetical protein
MLAFPGVVWLIISLSLTGENPQIQGAVQFQQQCVDVLQQLHKHGIDANLMYQCVRYDLHKPTEEITLPDTLPDPQAPPKFQR